MACERREPASDAVIVDSPGYPVLAGRYSVFADFNTRLQSLTAACQPVQPDSHVDPPGVIGEATRSAIARSLDCAALKEVPLLSPAADGALTESVWRAVIGDRPLPTLTDKTTAIVLTFEDTDFGAAPEWNFCQDTPGLETLLADGADLSQIRCYNATDPCSLLTWGPRGATAGFGREIQWILWLAWREQPKLIEDAFGGEFPELQRFFHLSGPSTSECNGHTALEHFMCSVWIESSRQARWSSALAQLGHSSLVRRIYAQLYAFREFDGGKMIDYFDLWHRLSLTPSEIDYVFFTDRATHYGGPFETMPKSQLVSKLAHCMRSERYAQTKNAAARRCLSRLEPHPTQPVDRLGRDVAFYREAYPEAHLSKKEITTWQHHIPLSVAHDFSLSDAKAAPTPDTLSYRTLKLEGPSVRPGHGRPDYCPANILSPRKRLP